MPTVAYIPPNPAIEVSDSDIQIVGGTTQKKPCARFRAYRSCGMAPKGGLSHIVGRRC